MTPRSLVRAVHRRVVGRWRVLNDFRVYAAGVVGFRKLLSRAPSAVNGSALIVAGNGMNVVWAQLWTILSIPVRLRGYRAVALTTHAHNLLNRYFRLLGVELLFLDDQAVDSTPAPEIADAVRSARTFEDFRRITYREAPVGEIALSTYSRNFGTGIIDLNDPQVAAYVRDWIGRLCGQMQLAWRLFDAERVKVLFFTEVFMEEYGAFYYAALDAQLNVVRFAGTVRDDAIIVQHLCRANDRIHHASIDPTTLDRLLTRDDDERMEAELAKNFQDRYGDRWHRAKRNHPNTKIMDVAEARRMLGVAPGRKVAVVYSHILYDTLFFFGTDLFADYAEWLVETTRAAIANPHLDWLIKVHPSNLWRGELGTLLKGRYEEERLLDEKLGALPPHVRIVAADTPINPLTWFQLADYGVTVRGTSGLEMAALGKTVITAGTGRYEGNGFTIDPPDAKEYLALLRRIHELPAPTPEAVRRARRYAHGIFVLKPFTLTSLRPRLKSGVRTVRASDDLIYVPVSRGGEGLAPDLARFGEWVFNTDDRDLLSFDS